MHVSILNLKPSHLTESNDTYTGLLHRLKTSVSFPVVYMFKFIIPADNRRLALLQQLFEEDSRFFSKPSRNGKFLSVTIKIVMLSSEEVIGRYREAAAIEGIMMF
jgi:uncharacterized protein